MTAAPPGATDVVGESLPTTRHQKCSADEQRIEDLYPAWQESLNLFHPE